MFCLCSPLESPSGVFGHVWGQKHDLKLIVLLKGNMVDIETYQYMTKESRCT